uniref:matrilin-4-like n=1 Tax=Pristiophorus japonicus TaxID=55135 RepID=UPI00398ED833
MAKRNIQARISVSASASDKRVALLGTGAAAMAFTEMPYSLRAELQTPAFKVKLAEELADHPGSSADEEEARVQEAAQPQEEVYGVFTCSTESSPLKIEVEINGVPVPMEVDTGASQSLMNQVAFEKLRDNPIEQPKMLPIQAKLLTYTNDTIPVVGGKASRSRRSTSYGGPKFGSSSAPGDPTVQLDCAATTQIARPNGEMIQPERPDLTFRAVAGLRRKKIDAEDMKMASRCIFLLLLLEVVLVENVVLGSKTQLTKRSRASKGDKANVQQDIEKGCVGKALDLVFLIDSSRSILPADFERVKEFLNNILRFLDIGLDKTRVGLVLYGSTVESVFSLKTHRKVTDMMRAVKDMVHLATGTMTGLAIEYTMNVAFSTQAGARPWERNVPRVAIIVTDGRPQDQVAEVAAQARDSGILIFAVGVGRVDMKTLRLLGSEPHEKHVFFVQNFSMIQTLLSEFQTKICDTDLCGVTDHGCEQICISTPGSYICKCKEGFILNNDQKTCRRIDHCSLGNHGCEHECTNIETSYICRCRTGYTLNPDKKTCRRIDFCVLARHNCEHDCVSTEDSYLCRCRKGYILNPDGKTCLECFNGAMDLVFIIDGSRSLGAQNFQSVKQFVSSMVDALEVAPNATRVGLVQYSTKVRTEFPLRRYSTASDVKAAVSRARYIGRGPVAGLALGQIFKHSFKVAEGARALAENIPKVVVVFTDGRAQDDLAVWANKAKQNGVNIYAVGVGKAIEAVLQQIASFPQDEHLYYAKDVRTMGEIAEKLKAQICKGNLSLGDQCKCEAVMTFQIHANEEIRRLTHKLDEVMNRLKTVENYLKAK